MLKILARYPLSLLLIGVFAITFAAPVWGTAVNKTLFRGDVGRTGYHIKGPEPPLELAWKFKTRRGVMEIESFPAVDDGLGSATVSGDNVLVGGHDGFLYCLDIGTGEKRWDFSTGSRVNAAPVVVDDIVYFGSMDNHLYALELGTGKEVWRYRSGVKTFRQITYGGIRGSVMPVGDKILSGG